MKKLMISTALAGVLAMPALAQDATTFLAERAQGSVEASTMIGARVYASANTVDADAFEGVQQDWTDIGEVNDVILSRDGTVDAVLVDVGGFLGIGERQVAVDMGALRFVSDDATDVDDWFLVMQGDRALLETAPAWGDMDGAAMTPVEGAETETAMADGAALTEGAVTDQTMADGTVVDPNAEVAADGTAVATTEGMATDGTMTDGAFMRDGFVAADRGVLTSEMLTGATVFDTNDASIGEVSNLVLAEDGQVTHVIVDVGGFLGLGQKPVALDMSQIEILQADGGNELRVYVPMSEAELEALPNAEG